MKRALHIITIMVCLLFTTVCFAATAKEIKELENKAEQGDADAQFSLGRIYSQGEGVKQDYVKARKWYEAAAAQGNAAAQNNLGAMYFDGKKARQDYAKAQEWWEKAAAQGHGTAQYNLGRIYYYGYGVEQDYDKAKEWFGEACDNGHKKGCEIYKEMNKERSIFDPGKFFNLLKP